MIRPLRWLILLLALLGPAATLAQDDITATRVPAAPPRITIPALEIDSEVGSFPLARSTWRISPWARGIGHLEGTGWFGLPGNVVLAGHAELPGRRPGIFADLETLAPGDEILIQAEGASLRYVVQAVSNVSMYDTSVVAPTAHEALTLITCDAASFDPRHQLYERRVVIQAVRA